MFSFAHVFMVKRINGNTAKSIRFFNTTIQKKETRDKIWLQLELPNSIAGKPKKISIETLPEILLEDCVDLIVNCFVKEEVTQAATGILNRPESVQECKEFISTQLRIPNTHSHVYLIHDETKPKPELIGFSAMRLKSKHIPDLVEEFSARTYEMKKYIEIIQAFDRLYPKEKVFDRYKIDCYYQDLGLAIHPKYRLLGIGKNESIVRKMVCKSRGVPVTTAWCTMFSTQRGCEMDHWETLFDISTDELKSYLGMRIKNSFPRCKLMAKNYRQ